MKYLSYILLIPFLFTSFLIFFPILIVLSILFIILDDLIEKGEK